MTFEHAERGPHWRRNTMFFAAGPRRHRRVPPPFGLWGDFGPRMRWRGRKAGRGDIRAAILALLAEQPMHGYQIIREISERSEDHWRPSPGSVYPTLQQLADEGLVRSSETDGRRVYELTEDGQALAAARSGPLPWEQAADDADDELVALKEVGFGLLSATQQVFQTGSEAQRERAMEILRGARKSIYQVLASDDEPAPE